MNGILLAVLSDTAIGLICAVILAIASKVMAVKEDETFIKIRECLPGANCGACGYTGCDGYAHALAEDNTVKTNLCVPGADNVSRQLSELMGVAFEDVVEQVAVVHCNGNCEATKDKMEYQGIQSCAAAKLFFGGRGSCTFGCMGLGDCANACPQNAICIEDGVARVNTAECIGCGICTKVCPNKLITVMDDVERVVVECSNTEKGAATRKKCTNGCIGCKKCEKVCTAGAIKVVNNLAVIDYSLCPDCENPGICAEVCTTGCIKVANFTGIHNLSA